MKFLAIITTILATFTLLNAYPTNPQPEGESDNQGNRVKRHHDIKYRVLFYQGGLAESLLEGVLDLNGVDINGIRHTDVMDIQAANRLYDAATRAKAIWDTYEQKIVKSWKPWYNVFNVDAEFRKYALDQRL